MAAVFMRYKGASEGMGMSGPTVTYSAVAITLHWLIAILIMGQIAGGLYMHDLPATSQKFALYQLHKSFGILVLALSILRLAWRLTHKPPELPAHMPAWEQLAARVSHVGFYVLMIGVPLAGWAMVSLSPKDVPTVLFNTIPLPHLPLGAPSEGAEELFAGIHEYMAFSIVGLLFIHIGAAVKHHFLDKDDVLARMAPIFKPRGGGA